MNRAHLSNFICDPPHDLIGDQFSDIREDEPIIIFFLERSEKSYCFTRTELIKLMDNPRFIYIDRTDEVIALGELNLNYLPTLYGIQYQIPIFQLPYASVYLEKFPVPNTDTVYFIYPSFISRIDGDRNNHTIYKKVDYSIEQFKSKINNNTIDLNSIGRELGGHSIISKMEWVRQYIETNIERDPTIYNPRNPRRQVQAQIPRAQIPRRSIEEGPIMHRINPLRVANLPPLERIISQSRGPPVEEFPLSGQAIQQSRNLQMQSRRDRRLSNLSPIVADRQSEAQEEYRRRRDINLPPRILSPEFRQIQEENARRVHEESRRRGRRNRRDAGLEPVFTRQVTNIRRIQPEDEDEDEKDEDDEEIEQMRRNRYIGLGRRRLP